MQRRHTACCEVAVRKTENKTTTNNTKLVRTGGIGGRLSIGGDLLAECSSSCARQEREKRKSRIDALTRSTSIDRNAASYLQFDGVGGRAAQRHERRLRRHCERSGRMRSERRRTSNTTTRTGIVRRSVVAHVHRERRRRLALRRARNTKPTTSKQSPTKREPSTQARTCGSRIVDLYK